VAQHRSAVTVARPDALVDLGIRAIVTRRALNTPSEPVLQLAGAVRFDVNEHRRDESMNACCRGLGVLCVLLGAIAGCATVVSQPLPDAYTGPTAILSDSGVHVAKLEAHLYAAEQIDGRAIDNAITATRAKTRGRGMVMFVEVPQRKVPAGAPITVKVRARAEYTPGLAQIAGDAREVGGTVTFTPEPDGVYAVNGIIGAGSSSVWIEDRRADRRVTDVVTATHANAGLASADDDAYCNKHIEECRDAKVLPEAAAEPAIGGIGMTCGSPYKLERDCSNWSGPTRQVTLEARTLQIAGSKDGRVVVVMSPDTMSSNSNHFANVRYVSVKQWLGEQGIKVTRVRAITTLGEILGYAMELDGDGYSLLAALPAAKS
jgi:hypothetical protein